MDKIETQDIAKTSTKTKSNSKSKTCPIIKVIGNIIHFYFDEFGCQVETKEPEKYEGRKNVSVEYSGEIGKTDFKLWIAE